MIITNRIAVCRRGYPPTVPLDERHYVVVHRTGMGENAKAVAEAFQDPDGPGAVTGYQMPYHIVIGRYGSVEQALPLSDKSNHALAWNAPGIAVAVVGDPRVEPLTRLQYDALVEVCAVLSAWLGGAAQIRGHDELKTGSNDPRKECPGKHLDMHGLRRDVKESAKLSCEDAGLVF